MLSVKQRLYQIQLDINTTNNDRNNAYLMAVCDTQIEVIKIKQKRRVKTRKTRTNENGTR